MGLIIGLHGAKGSGKDQFYKAVRNAFPDKDIRKIAYADPIKDAVSHIFDLSSEEEYDAFKRTDLTYSLTKGYTWDQVSGRQVVREIGMMMRSYDPSQFVRYVEETIQKAPDAIWCITDVRFDNEFHSIRWVLEGCILKIKRGGIAYDGHATEIEFEDSMCDMVIENVDLSLEQYNDLVIEKFKELMEEEL